MCASESQFVFPVISVLFMLLPLAGDADKAVKFQEIWLDSQFQEPQLYIVTSERTKIKLKTLLNWFGLTPKKHIRQTKSGLC